MLPKADSGKLFFLKTTRFSGVDSIKIGLDRILSNLSPLSFIYWTIKPDCHKTHFEGELKLRGRENLRYSHKILADNISLIVSVSCDRQPGADCKSKVKSLSIIFRKIWAKMYHPKHETKIKIVYFLQNNQKYHTIFLYRTTDQSVSILLFNL